MSLLRDFCIAVCCITPLILFYPRLMSSVNAFMGDDTPASVVAAPTKPAAPQAVAKARMATVVHGVNSHKMPSAKADVVFTLKKGAAVEILSTSGKWIEVGIKGQNGAVTRGWVYSTYLQADGAS
jgi:SH3-like domain-containing protein